MKLHVTTASTHASVRAVAWILAALAQGSSSLKVSSGELEGKAQGKGTALAAELPSLYQKLQFLSAINQKRCMHGEQPVQWDDCVADDVARHIESLDGEVLYLHPYNMESGPAAEVFHTGSYPWPTPLQAVQAWYSDINNCATGNPLFTDGCKAAKPGRRTHRFTAMVWSTVRKVGCGFGYSKAGTRMILCRFKSGEQVDFDFPNFGDQHNFAAHVSAQRLSGAQCGTGTGDSHPGGSFSTSLSPGVPASPSSTPRYIGGVTAPPQWEPSPGVPASTSSTPEPGDVVGPGVTPPSPPSPRFVLTPYPRYPASPSSAPRSFIGVTAPPEPSTYLMISPAQASTSTTPADFSESDRTVAFDGTFSMGDYTLSKDASQRRVACDAGEIYLDGCVLGITCQSIPQKLILVSFLCNHQRIRITVPPVYGPRSMEDFGCTHCSYPMIDGVFH